MKISTELTGRWSGKARSIVVWARDEVVAVDLEIRSDGSVVGTVGDARLVDARIVVNRSVIGRLLGIKTDWLVRGRLEGSLLAAKGVRRQGVTMPLNLVEGRLEGGLHSSGAHIGGPNAMCFSATGLVMRKE